MSDDLDGMLGSPELATRLSIGRSTARKLLKEWADNPDVGPAVTTRSTRHFVKLSDLLQWKSEQERAGVTLPGRGRPGPRKRMTDSSAP